MSQTNADRNMLFGIIALQMDFITRDQLVAAMQAWALAKDQPLGQILCSQKVLAEDTRALLEALVQKHLAQHGNDPEKSLAAVSSLGSVRADLQKVADPDVQASLSHFGTRISDVDVYATRAGSLGTASSSGLRFQILRPHARGGLGEVLVAHDGELHREVALKQIQDRHADDPESQARFLLEAEITGGLEHPGIVPVYGLGQYADGRPFYAMRFIRGDSLKEAIEQFHKTDHPGRDPGERSLALRALLGRFIDVCNAIAYAHSRGILHRDLKPGNVMLGKYGETLVVDWGLAKPLGEEQARRVVEPGERTLTPSSASHASHTMMGSAMGTPQFMSPEQAAGRLDILGPASDVYSLGATLYSLLTGVAPITDTDVGAVLQKVQRGDIPPPRTVKASVPAALEAICVKAMALQPENRYDSPRTLADDVEHWLADEPVSAWREPWTAKARRWLGRHRTLVTGAASAVAVATVTLAVATVLLTAANERERAARQLAEEREIEVRHQRDETEKQRKQAEHNYRLARTAVDRYHTEVSESVLLHEPGMQPLRKKLLEAAREFYEQFVREHGQEPGVHAELGKALFRLAQITGDIDSEAKAIELHQKARQVFANLPAAEAATPAAQADLAGTLHHLGRLYRVTDQPDKARDAYEKALARWAPLVAAHPEVDSYRADLARSQLGLGNVYQVTRRLDDAQDIYAQALDTRTKLAGAHPKVAEYQRELAVSYSNLALVRAAQGKTEKAEADYRAALTIQEQLTRDFPQISQYQNDLARSHFNLGDVLSQAGDASRAEASYQEAGRLWNELASKHPAVTQFHINVAETYTALATVYSTAGSRAKAEEAGKKAIAIKQKLAHTHADVPTYQGDLARGYYQLGNVYRTGAQVPQAAAAYQEALAILEKLARDLPDVPQYQGDLARTFNNLGLLRSDQGEKEQASESFRKALSAWEKLIRAHPGNAEFALGLSTAAYNLGNLEPRNGRGALEWYAQAVRALDALSPDQRRAPAAQTALRKTHWKRAAALTREGRHVEALQDWDQALEFAGDRDRPWFQLYRLVTLARAGAHAEATAEAEALASKAGKSGEALYHLVCAYALSAGAAAGDVKRAPDERQALANQYADRAVELLTLARTAGFFQAPANVERLRRDSDLDSVRMRAEFRKLLDEVGQPAKSADKVTGQ